jgi:hypothetical protein
MSKGVNEIAVDVVLSATVGIETSQKTNFLAFNNILN